MIKINSESSKVVDVTDKNNNKITLKKKTIIKEHYPNH